MLHVTSIRTATREIDLSPSGGGRSTATAVAVGDVQLCNAVEFLEVENACLQVEVWLGVADGDLDAQVDAVDHWLHAWFHSAEPVQIASGRSFSAVELLLDSMETPTWLAFGQRDGRVALLLNASLALVCDSA